jgi:hypothetical protein
VLHGRRRGLRCEGIASDSGGPARVWETATGKEVGALPRLDAGAAVAFAPGGRVVACGDVGGTVRLVALPAR